MSRLGKVLVTGTSVDDRFLRKLDEAGFDVHNPNNSKPPAVLSEEQLASELKGSVAYLLGGDEFATQAALREAQESLRVVAFLGVGYESFVDAPGAGELGVAVTNTPGTLTRSVAELTVGLLLSIRRQLPAYSQAFRDGRGGHEEKLRDVGGHRVGIIGLGAIGTRVAEMLTAGFGADVSYYSRTRKEQEETRLGIFYKPLPDLLASAEMIVVMVPETPSTVGMLGDSEIAQFDGNGVYLVNTSRPTVVVPSALLAGLKDGRIATAAFDGFYGADVPETAELLSMPSSRLVVTGHIGSLTHDARDAMAERCISSIINVVSTGADPYIVNGVVATA